MLSHNRPDSKNPVIGCRAQVPSIVCHNGPLPMQLSALAAAPARQASAGCSLRCRSLVDHSHSSRLP